MGFYVCKSLKAGPVRSNLSTSGDGVSAGLPGSVLALAREVTTCTSLRAPRSRPGVFPRLGRRRALAPSNRFHSAAPGSIVDAGDERERSGRDEGRDGSDGAGARAHFGG
jgi:hypothetical protein